VGTSIYRRAPPPPPSFGRAWSTSKDEPPLRELRELRGGQRGQFGAAALDRALHQRALLLRLLSRERLGEDPNE